MQHNGSLDPLGEPSCCLSGTVYVPGTTANLTSERMGRVSGHARIKFIGNPNNPDREQKMSGETQSFDAVVIGAGFSGMHMLKSLRDKLGLKVRVYEAGRRGHLVLEPPGTSSCCKGENGPNATPSSQKSYVI